MGEDYVTTTRREREMERLGREEPPSLAISIPLGLIGAAIGGVIGHYVFIFVAKQWGVFVPLLPGTFLGIGCGVFTRRKLVALGILCGLAGFVLGAYSQWRVVWFTEDPSFLYFLMNLHRIPVYLVMIVLGGLFAFWFGEGREGGVWRRKHVA